MPHSREVRATSHDRHDPLLVAALAADDLAGTDRDLAVELTRSCTDCALLHDDLRALARATASAPPPIAERPRDFRLTPADAARLQPGGWRRLVAALSGARSSLSRPLGVGLATIGLAGLLIGNIQLSFGSSAALPEAARDGTGAAAGAAPSAGETREYNDGVVQSGSGDSSAASAGPAAMPAASAAAVDITGQGPQPAPASDAPRTAIGAPAATDKSAGGAPPATELLAATLAADDRPFRPLNLLFGLAIVLGLAILLVSRRRGRPTA